MGARTILAFSCAVTFVALALAWVSTLGGSEVAEPTAPARSFEVPATGREALAEPPASSAPVVAPILSARTPAALVQRPSPPPGPWMSGRIACRVLDTHGAPIAGAAIDLGRELVEGAIELRTTTGLDGRFEARDLRPGRWHVQVSARGFESAEVVAQLLVDTPLFSGDIVLDIERVLAVTVRTGSGRPWPKEDGLLLDRLRPALAALCADPGAAFGVALAPVAQNVKSLGSQDAHWRIRHSEPGPVCLSVVAGVRVLASQPIAAFQDTAEVRLDPDEVRAAFRALSVRVVAAEDGAPIAAARVEARGELGEPRVAFTDDGGVAAVDGLPPDAIVVRAIAEGYCPGRASASWPALAPVEVRLQRAVAIEGVARFDSGEPAGEVWIWRTRADGQFYARAADARRLPTDRGRFLVDDLPPGRWTVSIEPDRVADGLSVQLDTRIGAARGLALVAPRRMAPDAR